jgi:hypothetical protein
MSQSEWPRTIWSEARQINSLNGLPDMPDDHLPPADFFRLLRRAGRDREAALFLAQALPRYEAVAWAAAVIGGIAEAQPPALRAALDAVRAWLDDPTEARRRVTGDVAGRTDPPAAATLCALAAFHAGGAIAPGDGPAPPAPRGLTGRFAGAALIAAAASAGDTARQLARALDAGDQIARKSLENGR